MSHEQKATWMFRLGLFGFIVGGVDTMLRSPGVAMAALGLLLMWASSAPPPSDEAQP